MAPSPLQVEIADGIRSIYPPHEQQRQPLSDLLRHAQLPLNTRCGGRGRCDGCIVELAGGAVEHIATGQVLQSGPEPLALRACEYRMTGEALALRIPPRSLLAHEPSVLTEFRLNVPWAHDPLWQQVMLDEHDLAAGRDPEHLAAAIAQRRDLQKPPGFATEMPAPPQGEIYATLERREEEWVIGGLSDAPSADRLGAAIDIGTTTVALLLVELGSGRIVGRAASFNQQMRLGDDVLTRISLCTDPAIIREFQHAVATQTIVPLLEKALEQAKATIDRIVCLSVAGNTTMQHLLAGVDPSTMGVAPFTPVFLAHRAWDDRAFWASSPHLAPRPANWPAATVHLLPGAAAYVGADLCAGAVASGLAYDDGPSLLVDVGTNGEIILKKEGKLYGCATAAGPAFEGAGLSCGVRAGEGAVAYIELGVNPLHVSSRTIGHDKHSRHASPIGLCGSAYIDFLAQARRLGLLTAGGRFDREALRDAGDHLMPWGDGDLAFRIAWGQGHRPIVISQADIASLMQAKAAVAAGILTLLERVGLAAADIRKVYLAGGFGTHMEARNAIDCGLLPGFTMEQIQPVGNTSLAGAYLALMDSGILGEMARIGREMEIVELNLDPEFESRYIDQLSL